MCSCCRNCCWTIWSNIGLMLNILLSKILPSLLDLSSDILNALDMIFAGSWKKWDDCPAILKDFFSICSTHNYSSKSLERITCGYVSLAIVILPGVIKALKNLAKHVKNQEYRKIPTIIFYLPYPLYILFIQLRALCRPKNEKYQHSLIRGLSMEAFYESFPQLVLQLLTIIYRYPNSTIQNISIIFSFVQLAKTVMLLDSSKPKLFEHKRYQTDIEEGATNAEEDNQSKEHCCSRACETLMNGIKYIFWIMPLYVTSVLYKVAAFTLTIAYLRLWSCATMLLLIIELVVLAKCSGLGDCASWMYPVFSNFFIVNIGGVDIEQKEKEKTIKDMNKMYKFAKRSVILSFFHHTLVLISIIWLVLEYGHKDKHDIIETNVDETVSSLTNFIVTALINTKKHWFDMMDMFSPPCSKKCEPLYRKETEDTYKKTETHIEERLEKYNFIILISSVILIGLFNLLLSIYSARDIKSKRDMGNKDQPLRHHGATRNVLCHDVGITAFVKGLDKEVEAIVKSQDNDAQTSAPFERSQSMFTPKETLKV